MQPTDLDNFSDACFADAIKLIHRHTGITIAPNRKSMVQGRLRKRVTELKLSGYEEYLDLVRRDAAEQASFIDLITTNETYFFRTPRIWTYLQDIFLPEWLARNPGKSFSAWSAAASSGDEAHSLGVLLQAFREKNPKFTFQVLGTDISREMVQLCKEGSYGGRSIASFKTQKPEWFSKFMQSRDGENYQAIPEIKARLKFKEHNLFKPLPSQESFDLILVRNVLIYFSGEDQEKVLSLLEPRLARDGVLIIGESESLSHIRTGYQQVQPLVYRKAPPAESAGKVA